MFLSSGVNGIIIRRDDFEFACGAYSESHDVEEAIDEVKNRFITRNIGADEEMTEFLFRFALDDGALSSRVSIFSVD